MPRNNNYTALGSGYTISMDKTLLNAVHPIELLAVGYRMKGFPL